MLAARTATIGCMQVVEKNEVPKGISQHLEMQDASRRLIWGGLGGKSVQGDMDIILLQ